MPTFLSVHTIADAAGEQDDSESVPLGSGADRETVFDGRGPRAGVEGGPTARALQKR